MFFGLDRNDNRVFIEDALSRGDYFCPTCGKPLVVKKGDVNIHHFAHWPKHKCTDDWNNPSSKKEGYDMSEWHRDWQNKYPSINQEVRVSHGDVMHRADVIIGNTIVEFQHSQISSSHFQDRTNFFLNLGFKVIWLFDFTQSFKNQEIINYDNYYVWNRPNSTFRDVTCARENVDIFFQISNEGNCIIRVDNVSSEGFELFRGSKEIDENAFLEYTGLINGECLPPNILNADKNDAEFQEFFAKYPIKLDKEQQRAVQTIDGANLVLAVPGSGKTTVLTYRLGYMALKKGIKPENILAITYTNAARDVMKERIKDYFHGDIKGEFDIRTINSLGLMIVNDKTNGFLKTSSNTGKYIGDSLKALGITPYSDTVKLYQSAISYIKSKSNPELYFNKVVEDKQLSPNFKFFYEMYEKKLKENNEIDFNDQDILALKYLKEDPELLHKYQNKYKYICVDEAQDTNQIQYELIKMIAGQHPNLFMVGDEDQSIYGFNGSYPEALLNFRDEYDNPYVLKLERNYRSTNDIVEIARCFIDKNVKRNIKDMYSYRGEGEPIRIVEEDNIRQQANYLLSEIKNNPNKDAAILYRENNSGISIAYKLWKNNIPYHFIKNDIDVFNTSNYKKVLSFLRLSVSPRDFKSFYHIYNSISSNIYYKAYKAACDKVTQTRGDLIDALEEFFEENSFRGVYPILSRIKEAKSILKSLNAVSINEAIDNAIDYIVYNEAQASKIREILKSIVDGNENVAQFLNKTVELEAEINARSFAKDGIALSTFHSAKGLEFDKVYLADIYDGTCPIVSNEDAPVMYQEERRLFYVAMTRAKDELILINQEDKYSSFIEEIKDYIEN